MSLRYSLGSATTALAVVGACKIKESFPGAETDKLLDMLFTGDGEAFNVRPEPRNCGRRYINNTHRLANSSKMYRRMHGRTGALACA
jgi:hypothetical protein